MTEFSNLGDDKTIPGSYGTAADNALNLTNPDSVLSGTSRGTQNLGGTNIRSEPQNTRIVVDDNTTNRVTLGKIGTGVDDWGMKVSKAGVNVDTATNDQLIFNSSQNIFKIAKKIVTTIPAFSIAGGPGSYSARNVAHGLGFAPITQAYAAGLLLTYNGVSYIPTASSYIPLPLVNVSIYYSFIAVSGTYYPLDIVFGVDATNVYLFATYTGVAAATSIVDIPVTCYLLQETASSTT